VRTKKSDSGAELTKYQAYTSMRLSRYQIKNAEYNPRIISDFARKRLRDFIETNRLVNRPVWNSRTGNLVGGHQRLSIIDALEGNDNYLIDVDSIDVSLEDEKTINVGLNNPNIQGQYELDSLMQLFDEDVNPLGAGFDRMDIEMAFGDEKLAEWEEKYGFGVESPKLDQLTEGNDEIEVKRIQALKDRKTAYRQEQDLENPDHYIVVVYPDAATKREVMAMLNVDPEIQTISAEAWGDLLTKQLADMLKDAQDEKRSENEQGD
jgi:hypothetical protein